MSPQFYVGTSGWHYDHWQGKFYPEKLARADWLEFYTHHFNNDAVAYRGKRSDLTLLSGRK